MEKQEKRMGINIQICLFRLLSSLSFSMARNEKDISVCFSLFFFLLLIAKTDQIFFAKNKTGGKRWPKEKNIFFSSHA